MYKLLVSTLFATFFLQTIASCQENAAARMYKAPGLLYNTLVGVPITRQSYIASENTYQNADGFGKEGTVRHVFNYTDGKSDTVLMNFSIRCGGGDDRNLFVDIWTDRQQEASKTIIRDPQRVPSAVEKDAYELFRTLCSQFDGGSAQAREGGASQKTGTNDRAMLDLIECCLAYCGTVKCNSPEATTLCRPRFLASLLAKYSESFPNADAYRKNLYMGAKSYNGSVIRACDPEAR